MSIKKRSDLHTSDDDHKLINFGVAVERYRVSVLKCTQVEFAKRLGISRSTLIAVEKGKPHVTFSIWIRVFSALNVDKDFLESVQVASLANSVDSEVSIEELIALFNPKTIPD